MPEYTEVRGVLIPRIRTVIPNPPTTRLAADDRRTQPAATMSRDAPTPNRTRRFRIRQATAATAIDATVMVIAKKEKYVTRFESPIFASRFQHLLTEYTGSVAWQELVPKKKMKCMRVRSPLPSAVGWRKKISHRYCKNKVHVKGQSQYVGH